MHAQRLALTVVAALAACKSGPDTADLIQKVDPLRAEAGTRVSIPESVSAELAAWIDREATLVGDVIEIDTTRVPFASQIVVAASSEIGRDGRRIVERKDEGDPATGIETVTLTNRSGVSTVLELLPRVQIAGAREFVARNRLVLRYRIAPSADHPVVFVATATGRASLVEAEPVRTVRGSAIRIGADVLTGTRGFEFRPTEERRP